MNWTSLLVFFIVLATVLSQAPPPPPPPPCVCRENSLCVAVRNYNTVIQGTIQSISKEKGVQYQVKIQQTFKGNATKTIWVTANQTDSCTPPLAKKESYLLFLTQKGQEYWLGSCFNKPWANVTQTDLDIIKNCTQPCGPTCTIFCPNGNVLDQNGCPTCQCNQCPNGVAPSFCFAPPCSFRDECPEAVSCVDDYCGGCTAHWFDGKNGTGNEICKGCPPLTCAVVCQYGYKKDPTTGCPTCSCNPPPVCSDGKPPVNCFQDPCASWKSMCPGAARCVPNYCGTCSAQFYDVNNKTFNCTPPPPLPPCGEVNCALFCEWGFKNDSTGCPVCSCKDKPSCPTGVQAVSCKQDPCGTMRTVCPAARSCQVSNCGGCVPHYFDGFGKEVCQNCSSAPCPVACAWGYQKDNVTGCQTCTCNPPPVCGNGKPPTQCSKDPCVSMKTDCPSAMTCSADVCNGCKPLYWDAKGNQVCKCPPVTCDLACPYGFQRDSNNCPICNCTPPPVCQPGVEPVNCFQDPCVAMNATCPGAKSCLPDYCGSCKAHFMDAQGREICKCPPLFCTIGCQWGFKPDANGCPTCSCQPPPMCSNGTKPQPCGPNACQNMQNQCPRATKCVPDACQGCKLRYYNSTGAEICVNCKPPPCNLSCAPLQTDPATGCQVCKCGGGCPEVMCTVWCPNGYALDENGCRTCKCSPPPPPPRRRKL